MASFLVPCQRCSTQVRFMARPEPETRVYCDGCWEWIRAEEKRAMPDETLKERLARKKKPTKASWGQSANPPLVEGTPLEKLKKNEAKR